MSRPPIEIQLGFCIRPGPHLRHHRNHMFACQETAEPGRYMKRRLGAQHFGKRGKPFPDLGGLIVHDVVDAAGLAALDRHDGRGSRIVDMQERPPSGAVAD